MPGTQYSNYDEDARYEASWMQTDRRYRFGLWGLWDNLTGRWADFRGPKGKMGQLARLLNSKEVATA